jgi:RND family efflux transporter MFP subunit
VILIGGGLLFTLLLSMRKDVAKSETALPAPLVEVVELKAETYQTVVKGFGTVQPHRYLRVLPQVGGAIVDQNKHLVVGGRIREGELLVQIDQRDYEAARAGAASDYARAAFELQLEEGQQVVAKREWELLGPGNTSEVNKDLALRVPQLARRKAELQGAGSRVMKAEADLERTTINSPFDALVLSESAEIGQLVSSQTPIAELVAVDEYRVQVTLPVERLARIRIPRNPGDEGSRATVVLDTGNGTSVKCEGRVVQLLPDLDPNGRLARIHVSIRNPLKLGSDEGSLPLLIGSYVRVEMDGGRIDDAFILPRVALRDNARIWTVDKNDQLQWQEIEILDRSEDHVVVRDGLVDGMRVIVSALSVSVPGMNVRIWDGSPQPPADAVPVTAAANIPE